MRSGALAQMIQVINHTIKEAGWGRSRQIRIHTNPHLSIVHSTGNSTSARKMIRWAKKLLSIWVLLDGIDFFPVIVHAIDHIDWEVTLGCSFDT